VTSEKRHIFVGELRDTPLPEMLATIHRHRVPGVLEAELSDCTKRLFIREGDVTFASSTNRGDSLGQALLASGRLTHEQFRASIMRLLENPRKRHGQILVEMGLLSEAEMREAVLDQVQRIMWSLFVVEDGHVTFVLGDERADEVYQLRIPTPRAVMYGCATVGDARKFVARLGSRTTILARQPTPEHLRDFTLQSGEEELLALADGRRTLFELCENGPYSPGLNARILYACQCLGLVQRTGEAPAPVRVQVAPPSAQ
jgi:hypothetical protein